MAYRIEVRGEWGGTTGHWRPAITGTLNQTDGDDATASTFASGSSVRQTTRARRNFRIVELEQ